MLNGKLWPVHPHPQRDELLSSWLVRIAHANGCKVQTFCHQIFKQHTEVWNRDIDRLAPEWLVVTLARRTGLRPCSARKTTLRKYQGILFQDAQLSGQLKWVTPLQIYHRTRLGYGQQCCPLCLAEDKDPYYRTCWRLALNTFCPKHKVMLIDRCPNCSTPIEFHRAELGSPNKYKPTPIDECWVCRTKLSAISTTPIHLINDITMSTWLKTLQQFGNTYSNIKLPYTCSQMSVLRHFCGLIVNTRLVPYLQAYICDVLRIPTLEFTPGRVVFEQRSVWERHHALQLAWWLMGDWPKRLYYAWYEAVQFNRLLKDLDDMPLEYKSFVNKLNRRTHKALYKAR